MNLSLSRRPDEEASIRTIHAALDAGVGLLDTADAYAPGEGSVGHNERLIARALRGRSAERPMVATKGGHTRPDGRWELDGSPGHLQAACDASLAAPEVDEIDLYQLHRPDPKVPFAESVGALAELRDAGKIRRIGLSNVNVAQIAEARAIAPIASVQNELSFFSRGSYDLGEVAACDEQGISFLAWGPLGGRDDSRSLAGRASALTELADRHSISPQRLTLAWMLTLSDTLIPVVGATRAETFLDSMAATGVAIGPDERRILSRALTSS